MSFLHKRSCLLALAALLCGAALAARAQDFQPTALTTPPGSPLNVLPSVSPDAIQPFGPVEPGNLDGMQLFAPADLSEYGDFPRPNVGPWFQYDRIYWSTHQPKTVPDNEYMDAAWQWGNRFELGYMLDDDTGWMTSILKTNYQLNNQTVTAPPVLENFERMSGIELDKVYRYPVGEHGGVWELYVGARFFQFHDRFINGVVAPTDQDMEVNNDILGPQIGLRWESKRERWKLITEVRAMGGANFENATLTSTTLPGANNTVILDTVEFATVGEFRIETEFQVSNSVSLRVGYTALGGTGIGRASDRLDTAGPSIINGGKQDAFFTNGLTFGVDFNR